MPFANKILLNKKINMLKSFIDNLTPKQVEKLINGEIDNAPYNKYFVIVIQVIFNEMIDGQPQGNVYELSNTINEISNDIISVIKYWYDKANVRHEGLMNEYGNCKSYRIDPEYYRMLNNKPRQAITTDRWRKLGTLRHILNDKATKCLIDDDDEY